MTPARRTDGWLRLALVAAAVLALDQAAKAIVVDAIEPGERIEVLPFLDLVHVMNEGVAFGFLGDGSQTTVLLVTGGALLLLLAWFARDPTRPWSWLAIGLLVGGALGNLVGPGVPRRASSTSSTCPPGPRSTSRTSRSRPAPSCWCWRRSSATE